MANLVVSPGSAIKLRKLMEGQRSVPVPKSIGGEVQRLHLLVRCTSATPAGTGISAECYPAVVVDPVSDELVADQPELGEVWLTVISGGVVAPPTVNEIYAVVMSGEHTEGSDTRPRCFATAGAAGGATVTAAMDQGNASTVAITPDNTWVDTTAGVTLPSAGDYLLWGQVTTRIQVSATGGGFQNARVLARIWNITDSVVITPWSAVNEAWGLDTDSINTGAVMWLYTAAASKAVRIEVLRGAGPTWTAAEVMQVGSYLTLLGYLKLS